MVCAQEDIVCLSSALEDEAADRLSRGYLAAEGYGARFGHLERDRTGEEDRVSAAIVRANGSC